MIRFGRHLVNEPTFAAGREWLVTNGIGGFAAGTIAGALTRRYHGLLVAALAPPLGRTLLVSKIDETVETGSRTFDLGANAWEPDGLDGHGFDHLDAFYLDGTTPVWRYRLGEALLAKSVWMAAGTNTTYVRYRFLSGRASLALWAKTLVNYRDYHGTTRGGWRMDVTPVAHGLRIEAFGGATPFYLLSHAAQVAADHTWYNGYFLAGEAYRGLDAREDHLLAGTFMAELAPGEEITVVLSTEPELELDGRPAFALRRAYEQDLLDKAPGVASDGIARLVLAADQFIVARPSGEDKDGRSIIAGYPWFGDWGRDTMIALPGLTLATGRPVVARSILRTFARYVDQGMLPNRFPDAGETPEYNTVDATLWYFEALRAYRAATGDDELIVELFPVLADIIAWHQRGTRYQIHVDAADGLLYAGEAGVQLTWMDAKVGDWVVTPRIGKPVEVNALWVNALRLMADWAELAGLSPEPYEAAAGRARTSFARFWNEDRGYCYDVLDGPDGHEDALRPNQLLAISLGGDLLPAEQEKKILEVCLAELWTPHGLRSLAPGSPGYVGRYGGGPVERDGAYHQGTVWGWLIGPLASAHWRLYGDRDAARALLVPLFDQLHDQCVGTIAEIFDGDPPFTPRGAFAQAWSVAEILRVWQQTEA